MRFVFPGGAPVSVRTMALVWDRFPGSGSALLTMLALADFGNDQGGSIHPSMATIAAKVRLTQSQARRVVHNLIANDWISVVGNDTGGAPGSTRHYQLNLKKLNETASAHASPTPSAGARGSTGARASAGAREGSHPCAERASAHASQTINEPLRTIKPSSSGDEVKVSKEFYTTKRKRKLSGWKLEAFNRFWGAFVYKSGKAEAADAWLDIANLTAELLEKEIIPAAKREGMRRHKLRELGRTPKMAQGWLSGRRWEDEVETPPKQETIIDPYTPATPRRSAP